MDQLITFNVGGKLFATHKSTVIKYPDTLLGKFLSHPETMKMDVTGSYFWDRNSDLFNYILDFYRTGKIVYPKFISKKDFHAELEYWGIPVPKLKLKFEDIVNTDPLDRLLSTLQYFTILSECGSGHSYSFDLSIIYRILVAIEHYLEDNTDEVILPYKEGADNTYTDIVNIVQKKCLKQGKLSISILELPAGDANPDHTKDSYTENGIRKIRKIIFSLE